MKCPFELPVRHSSKLDRDGLHRIKTANNKNLADGMTDKEADYIVEAINSHEKLVKELREARRLIHDQALEEAEKE